MFSNPLIDRYRFSALRPKQLWVFMAVYFIAVAVLLLINASIFKYQHIFADKQSFLRSIHYQLHVFLFFILCLLGGHNTSSAIKDELADKSYDFLRMLPLSAASKAIGILVGKNLLVLLLAVMTCVLLFVFGYLGKVSLLLLGQILLLLASCTVFINFAALLNSVMFVKKQQKSSNMIGFIFLGMFLLPYIFGIIMSISKVGSLEMYLVGFFNLHLPMLVLISIIALYFSCWIFKGILRKFDHEMEALFTRGGANVFMLGYVLVVLGLFWPYLEKGRVLVCYSYWLVSFLGLVVIPFGSRRSFDKYVEFSGMMGGKMKPGRQGFVGLLWFSNLSTWLLLFIIWAVFAVVGGYLTGQGLIVIMSLIMVLLSFYVFILLLIELQVVYSVVNSRINILLGFIAMICFVLPLIFSPILGVETLYKHSIIGFFGEMLGNEKVVQVEHSIWIVNILLCLVPVYFIRKRYLHILAVRQNMQG